MSNTDTNAGSSVTGELAALERCVKRCCIQVLNDPAQSQYVKPAHLKQQQPLANLLEDDSRAERVHHQRIGFVLRQAEYADQWSNHTYRIDPSKLTDTDPE